MPNRWSVFAAPYESDSNRLGSPKYYSSSSRVPKQQWKTEIGKAVPTFVQHIFSYLYVLSLLSPNLQEV